VATNEHRQQRLGILLDSWRGRLHSRAALDAFIADARSRDIDLTLREITDATTSWHRGEGTAPRLVVALLAAYLRDHAPERLLDPWAGRGILIDELAMELRPREVVAVDPNADAIAMARELGRGRVDWINADPRRGFDEVVGVFDAIVSMPPLGMRRSRRTLVSGSTEVEIDDEEGRLAALDAALRLAPEAEAIFVVTDSLFSREGPTIWNRMDELGIHASAVIAMPPRMLAPVTSIATSLLIVGHRRYERLFVGQVEGDDFGMLLENLRARREGPTPQLGRLVDRDGFRGVTAHLHTERLAAWAARAGVHAVTLSEISDRIGFYVRRLDAFEDAANAVYVSMVGVPKTAAATNVASLRTKPENCFQLVLKPELALAEYVAAFFNSERGRALRASWSSGATIQRIPRAALQSRVIYLPDVERQAKIVRTDDAARNLRSRLAQIESALWEDPSALPELEQQLAGVIEDERAWIEALPFPLASILWRYYGTIAPRERVEHLLHFFEALALFAVSLLLSGFYSDSDVFAAHRDQWFKRVRSLTNGTFGTWTTLHSALAATVRGMLGTGGETLLLDLFRTTKTTLLAALASEDMEGVLDSTRQERNAVAHGGASDQREWQRRLDALETDLTAFREITSGAFRDYILLRPALSSFEQGVHRYSADSLMGSHRDFATVEVMTTTPMERGRLYNLDPDTRTPLQVLPLLQIRAAPRTEEDACYFYSGIEDDKVKLVSYHFGREATIEESAPEIKMLISSLTHTPS
jgi:hypothetical protein